ncbi:glycoside hydrolase family 27 protein [Guyanagaster necrorhizus]|uniref:Alpha-galactosidase n=1 Tax=Guyanagaster necrorhizus TaxID=856835 RepID=A0A9P7VTB7_9AGAR|nr:glycoside hydrolase family 27 protein [Guyanagaster necrorhizus MCA 3950]KAG7445709.1 glycoside hydrolase family 27 protein [Guyanagaster necrorhizus MCA 3950]
MRAAVFVYNICMRPPFHYIMISYIKGLFLLSSFFTAPSSALDNGVGVTPAMGWNLYNAFLCATVEDDYRAAAQALVDLGLADAGYKYMNLDCGWQGTERDSDGGFTWNSSIIPSGIPALADYVHSLGLEFGLYSDGGYYACDSVGGTAHYLGSLGHEEDDAESFASWGADYLKYDNCYAVSETDFVDFDPPIAIEDHFVTMRDALAATDRPILFSACEWGVQDPARWPGSEVANSWRIANDIGPPASWDSIFRILNQVVPITQFAEPGGWNDLDLLYVGNDLLTVAEQQTHFAFWSAVKSPLMISTALTSISDDALGILLNERIIALNQDPLGKSISFRRRYANDHDVWSGPLSDGSTVVVVINFQTNATRSLTFQLADVGFSSARAIDLITGNSLGTLTTSHTTTVAMHGSLVLKLTNVVPITAPRFTYYEATASSSILEGGANIRQVNSSISVVGYVGNGGTLTITGVDGGAGGTKLLSFDYINGDVTFYNNACSNCRNAYISVNGGDAVQAQMPISAQSWDILLTGFLISVSGFKTGTDNTIEIFNNDGYTPDFYRIGVAI